jgi:hypothetical protein
VNRWSRRRNGPGWLIRNWGRRGVFLVMFGIIYVIMGANILFVLGDRFDDVPVVGDMIDSHWWGLMWLVGGLVAIGNGLARARRAYDEAGFLGLLIPPFVWTLFYAASLAVWFGSAGLFGNIRSLSGVAAWSVAWSVVLLISGWPDTEQETRERER